MSADEFQHAEFVDCLNHMHVPVPSEEDELTCFVRHSATLSGTIVRSAAFGVGMILDQPTCGQTVVAADVDKKWIGRHVIITGSFGGMADREWYKFYTIESIEKGRKQ